MLIQWGVCYTASETPNVKYTNYPITFTSFCRTIITGAEAGFQYYSSNPVSAVQWHFTGPYLVADDFGALSYFGSQARYSHSWISIGV